MDKKIIALCSIIFAIFYNGYGQNEMIVNGTNLVSNNENVAKVNNKDNIRLNSRNNNFEFSAKNVITINGSDLYIVGSASINYERHLLTYHEINYLLNIGYWTWYVAGSDYNSNTLIYYSRIVPISLSILTGLGNNHLDLNCGTSITLYEKYGWNDILGADEEYDRNPKPKYSTFVLLANIGYRYQRPEGGFVFKIFVGLTGIGIGLGGAF